MTKVPRVPKVLRAKIWEPKTLGILGTLDHSRHFL